MCILSRLNAGLNTVIDDFFPPFPVSQDGEGSKEAEGQNVLICLFCANMPGGA